MNPGSSSSAGRQNPFEAEPHGGRIAVLDFFGPDQLDEAWARSACSPDPDEFFFRTGTRSR